MKMTMHSLGELDRESHLGILLGHDYLYSPKSMEYEDLYQNGKYQDLSFVINLDNRPVLAFPLTMSADEFSFFGRPLKFFFVKDMKPEEEFEVINYFFVSFDKLIAEKKVTTISFFNNNHFTNHFFNQITENETHISGVIDLKAPEELILRSIRKSYRSLINWGKRELKTILMDDSNLDKKIFEDVRQFHIRVAGRETRSASTWDKQFELIKNKEAYLVAGYLGEVLCSAALILYGNKEAYYGVAINDRSMMGDNKPLGHYTVYCAIWHARKLGLEDFNLGLISYDKMAEKDRQIALFKKGFTSTLDSQTIFKVSISNS